MTILLKIICWILFFFAIGFMDLNANEPKDDDLKGLICLIIATILLIYI